MYLKIGIGISLMMLISCGSIDGTNNEESYTLNEQFKAYWYDGSAEVSSFELTQARYGELRKGEAVMIFVTEPFSPDKMSKPDDASTTETTVLKMNFTREFNTGVYPYSIMTSVFYPLETSRHAIKLATSTQEWCGQMYMELQKNDDFEVQTFSYFEDESLKNQIVEITHLEDELWTSIRVDPNHLPIGEIMMIPSFSYLRLMHKETKAYSCTTKLIQSDTTSIYSINYPDLNRKKEITFEAEFPYKILQWEESYPCGSCNEEEILTSKGILNKTLKMDYWNKNHNVDTLARKNLGLH